MPSAAAPPSLEAALPGPLGKQYGDIVEADWVE